MEKILVTPRSFGKGDNTPVEMLEEAGYTLVRNPYGRIMTKEEMIGLVGDVIGVISGLDPLDADVLRAAKRLKAISKYGVGMDNIDLAAAQELGIRVKNAAGANSNAVADYAFTLMMACARRLTVINDQCHRKDWSKLSTLDIYGKKLGILGLGAIGKGLAKRASGFDMDVSAYDVFWDEAFAKEHGIRKSTPGEIYANCDFISVHMPLTDETRGMIGAEQFALMKPTAILINTARGGIVDEAALIDALKNHRIYAAGFDAFAQEPPANEELYCLDNLIMGSHCGASTAGATFQMGVTSARNLLEMIS